ncbi:LacI family DNA-binding transcriptional regulator [Rubellicoccus peritrichatus]|uniref:LacI family DNA-binding transcriptional regulator n=1 Tax=Rubellicoccus peritrichatus TaxID=3080537 RepID=A0AAQ3L7G8_9BACT|nr:LacI family DNA-binding transcriptional regulator [Puniceicoccus sp. CR14]WOO40062.1 LacI family DNA-binding transcriptional regulator [Puniceicoccus sp. CR14]
MSSKKINQKDIAKKLNISPATVSLVLSNPDTSRASQETKRRIFEYASRVPQNSTQADTILMLTDESIIQFHYGNSLLSGAQSRSAELGLKFEMITPKQDLSQILATRKVRGLLLASWKVFEEKSAPKLTLPQRVVTLNIERRAPFKGIGIMSDHYDGMSQAIEKLKNAGHTRIAFLGYKMINTEKSCSRTKERIIIFNEALEANGLNPSNSLSHLIRDPKQESIDRTEDILKFLRTFKGKKRPTAVIAFNDILAAKVINLATREGIKVPADLSVIGIDNEPACENTIPAITSISPEFVRMGRVAVNAIHDNHLWAPQDRPSRIVVPSTLVERESIAAAAY